LIGVVLAGGAGRRLGGGGKAGLELRGRPLVAWVAAALGAVTDRVVVAAKEGAVLPALDGAEVWREPVAPVHPLAGIAWTLSRAEGRDVLVCAVDLPFCADAVRAVAAAAGSMSGAGWGAGAGSASEAGWGAGAGSLSGGGSGARAGSLSGGGSGAGAGAPVVVAEGQPLLGVYRAAAAAGLHAAVEAGRPVRATVAALGALSVAVPDPERTLFNVNTPEDLARAEAMAVGG